MLGSVGEYEPVGRPLAQSTHPMKPFKKQFLEAIAKIERFSAAPRVLSQAMRLLANPDSDLDDITKLIRSDAALTGDILRGANSAFYALGEKVPSLERAIQKIGFGECNDRSLAKPFNKVFEARTVGHAGIDKLDNDVDNRQILVDRLKSFSDVTGYFSFH